MKTSLWPLAMLSATWFMCAYGGGEDTARTHGESLRRNIVQQPVRIQWILDEQDRRPEREPVRVIRIKRASRGYLRFAPEIERAMLADPYLQRIRWIERTRSRSLGLPRMVPLERIRLLEEPRPPNR
jgi:hypothetical protein